MQLHFHFLVKTYNFSSYIIDYLESLRYQITHYSRDYYVELTVVDDCSSDNTVEIVNNWLIKYKNLFGKIEVLSNPYNLGISQSQLLTLNKVNSDYFHIMDGDDLYNYPNVFEFIINANQYDYYFSPTIRFNFFNYKKSSFIRSLLPYLHFYRSKDKLGILSNYNPLPNPGSRVSKELILRRLEEVNYSIDYVLHLSGGDIVSWLYAFNSKEYKIGYSFIPYVLYRVGSGVSTKKNSQKRSFDIDLSNLGFGQLKYDRPFLLRALSRIQFKISQFIVILVSVIIERFPYPLKEIIMIDRKSREHLNVIYNLKKLGD
jgi:glycosyltransferase involved in cell wall biosynthesis